MHNITYRIIVFLLPAILLSNAGWATTLVGHKACTDCHQTTTPGAGDLIKPVTELCVGCHEYGGNSDHAVGVPPGKSGSGGLPLIEGKITCATCHDMHAETRMLLRINTEALCLACHPGH